MARGLVWTCGGVLVVGGLAFLCATPFSHREDQAQAAPARRSPSTPASASLDSVRHLEAQLQQKLMRRGALVPPGPGASPVEVKAYRYMMESKSAGRSDDVALQEAAQRILDEKEREHAIRREEHRRQSQERHERERQEALDRKPILPPEVAARLASQPAAPPLPPQGQPFTEDPANPLPKHSPK